MQTSVLQMSPEKWSERHAAWILSFCFHVLVICFLLTHSLEKTLQTPERAPQAVRLIFAQPEPPPELPVFEDLLPAGDTLAGIPDIPPLPIADPSIETQERQARRDGEVAKILEEYGSYASAQRKAAHDEKKDRKNRLDKIDLGVKGVPFFPEFSEGRIGPIRILNVKDGDPEGIKQVLAQYGIRTDEGMVETVKPSFLSSASVGNAVYHATNKPGYFEFFLIPEAAERQMAWLEQNYMSTHGYTPDTARIDRVMFGVVRRMDGRWDLGILDIQVRRFAPLRKSADTAPPE